MLKYFLGVLKWERGGRLGIGGLFGRKCEEGGAEQPNRRCVLLFVAEGMALLHLVMRAGDSDGL